MSKHEMKSKKKKIDDEGKSGNESSRIGELDFRRNFQSSASDSTKCSSQKEEVRHLGQHKRSKIIDAPVKNDSVSSKSRGKGKSGEASQRQRFQAMGPS